MNIQDEYARLQAKLATPQGVQEVEDAWQVALNYEKRDGEWYKKADSAGGMVAGFAIDPETKKYEIGIQGRDHHLPRLDLIELLVREKVCSDWDEAEGRVIKGNLATVEGWRFPFLLLNGFWKPFYIELESFLLKKEVGLPIRGLLQGRPGS